MFFCPNMVKWRNGEIIKCNKQQEKYCLEGKDMHFRWHRQNPDPTRSDRTGSRIGSWIGSQKRKVLKKKIKKIKSFMS